MAIKANERIKLVKFSGRIKIFFGRGDLHSFEIVEGALEPDLQCTIVDEDDVAIDLSSGTGTFTMVRKRDGTRVIDAQAMVLGGTPSDGEINYEWTSGDTDAPGAYWGEVRVTPSGGQEQPMPELVDIMIHQKLSS